MARKNWLSSDSPDGTTANALCLTIVEMAKAYDLNLYKYLSYLLDLRPNKNMSDEEQEAFTPWNEEVKAECSNKAE